MQQKNNKYNKLIQKLFERQINYDESKEKLSSLLKENRDILIKNNEYQKYIMELKEQLFIAQQNEIKKIEQLNIELKKSYIKYQDSLKNIKNYEQKFIETEYLITFLKNQNKPTEETKQKSILAVDDSAVIRAKMKKMLFNAGYNVTLAKDGDEAIFLLPNQQFDLIITDLEMPGYSGLDVMTQASKFDMNKNTPVILITGHEEIKFIIGESENIAGVYKKPWKDDELLRKIKLLFTLTQNIE